MALNLGFASLSLLSHGSFSLSKFSEPSSSFNYSNSNGVLFLLVGSVYRASFFDNLCSSPSLNSKYVRIKASLSGSDNDANANSVLEQLDDELLNRVSSAKDADEALQMIAEKCKTSGGVLANSDCCAIISTALERNNSELALSIFSAMRSSFAQGLNENGSSSERWNWSRPDVYTCTTLICGLASSLRVSDAIRMISAICRVGVSSGEEVPFGKIVKCPSCMVAIAVAQPQQGIQVVSCSKCCYQYELVSGNITRVESEEISMDIPAWKRGIRFLQTMKQNIPAAVHSILVETPSGIARTYKFATKTVDLPALEGERVTVAAAAPSTIYRELGPLKLSPKPPEFYSGEPMCLTNHRDGRESVLLRAPSNRTSSLLNPSVFFPLIALLASGDAATGIIDPSLPKFISVAAFAYLALGATLNTVVLPQINRLPERLVAAVGIKQKLLNQYDVLQSRIADLKEAAVKEVWMLARMCQLENKIIAVGEPSYRARRSKVKRVREGLENSLMARIELIDSYARISSMIEIEVEMDSDVLVAEAASNAEAIAEQIQQTMELENLEERWRLQAEANDEVERLLSAQSIPNEQF